MGKQEIAGISTSHQDSLEAVELNSPHEAIDCTVCDGADAQWMFTKGCI